MANGNKNALIYLSPFLSNKKNIGSEYDHFLGNDVEIFTIEII